jgi:hypothetical protein
VYVDRPKVKEADPDFSFAAAFNFLNPALRRLCFRQPTSETSKVEINSCPRAPPLFPGRWPVGVVAVSAMTALYTPSIYMATRSGWAVFPPTACKLLIFMVRPDRFELPTFWFVARRSIQLSYGRANGAVQRYLSTRS